MTELKRPGARKVAAAWLATLGLQAATGEELPADLDSWSEHGFVCVPVVAGGSPGRHVAMRNPVLQIDCWACRPGSDVSPWGKASDLAEQVIDQSFNDARQQRALHIDGFERVLLRSAYALTEPREIPNDGAGFARMTFDLSLLYTVG